MGFKAGMTHIMRNLNKPGSKRHKKNVVEGTTVIECPPMKAVGVVGYEETVHGLRAVSTVWSKAVVKSKTFKRRLYKNWTSQSNQKKAFAKYAALPEDELADRWTQIKHRCKVVRIICHTNLDKLSSSNKQKKAHIMEIQVNGGDTAAKVAFCQKLMERDIRVTEVFKMNDLCDTIAVSKGRGTEGVVTRWGVTRLPRKTHRGLRKVACIGAWHPSRVSYSVARVGQNGYHHRTELHKKIYKVYQHEYDSEKPEDQKIDTTSCQTEKDLTKKGINPMGGWKHYGLVQNDYVMIKGSCPGCVKRPITLRKTLHAQSTTLATEEVTLEFIDTSSKFGHGRFQTASEKEKFMGPLKRQKNKRAGKA